MATAGSVLGACTSARNELGTANSLCFVALPTAADAVGRHGHLIGVRLVSVDSLRKTAPELADAAADVPGPRITRVCLVGFIGHYVADTVKKPLGQPHGRIAVVALEYPDHKLLATLILRHPLVTFGHSHLGLL